MKNWTVQILIGKPGSGKNEGHEGQPRRGAPCVGLTGGGLENYREVTGEGRASDASADPEASLREIAEQMALVGKVSPSGQPYGASSVRRMLAREQRAQTGAAT
jgi:hypothetical protein